MPKFAKFMCLRGAIQSELADAFNVSIRTLQNWINQYPELHDAMQIGVETFNTRVERALAERAIGFFVTLREEVKDAKTGEIKFPAVRRYYPPDTTAAIFFLKNRLRNRWRDVQDHNSNQRTFKSSEELTIEIRKDILELQDQGYLSHREAHMPVNIRRRELIVALAGGGVAAACPSAFLSYDGSLQLPARLKANK